MSKTFTELFTELPTDLQRVVYQHLFSYCLEEIKNIKICRQCKYGRTIGHVLEYKKHKRNTCNCWHEICYEIDDHICHTCFQRSYVGEDYEPYTEEDGSSTWWAWEITEIDEDDDEEDDEEDDEDDDE
jgi:hypothetical protein